RDCRNVRVAEPSYPISPWAPLLSAMERTCHSSWTAPKRAATRRAMHLTQKFAAALAFMSVTAFAATPQPQLATVSRAAATEPFAIAANPLATAAGLNVLKRGGSAVDAAIAIQAMLSLVEPQSSGMGGGAFMTYFDARTGKITVYDGREVAPAQ